MIEHRYFNKLNNKIKIDNSMYGYKIIPSESDVKSFDTKHTIKLSFKKNLYMKFFNRRKYSFYFINEDCKKIKDLRCNIYYNNISVTVIPNICEVTTKGISGDRIKECSGLYEMVVYLPKRINIKYIYQIEISYIVKENFQVQKDNCYNYVIIPRNYSKKMSELSICVDLESLRANIELQQLSCKQNVQIADSFKACDGSSYTLFEGSLKPDMSSCYFVNLSFID